MHDFEENKILQFSEFYPNKRTLNLVISNIVTFLSWATLAYTFGLGDASGGEGGGGEPPADMREAI